MSFFDQLIRFSEATGKHVKVMYDPLREISEKWYITCSNADGMYFAYHENLEKCSHKILEEMDVLE